MTLLKFLFTSTAVGAVVVTAPLAFELGKIWGKAAEKHQSLKDTPAESVNPSATSLYKHKAEATPWSDGFGSQLPVVDSAEDLEPKKSKAGS